MAESRKKRSKRVRKVRKKKATAKPDPLDAKLPPASSVFVPVKSNQVRRRSKAKFADDPTNPELCHAATRAGKRCGNRSVFGRQVCRRHGGLSTGAPMKSGLYSLANTRLGPILDRLRENIELTRDLDETLAVACTLLQGAIDRYKENDTPDFRKLALKLFDEAAQEGDPQEQRRKLVEFRKLLQKGIAEDRALTKVEACLDRVQRFQKDYAQLQLTADRAMNEKQLVVVFGEWLEIVAQEAGREVALTVASKAGLPSA